MFKLKAFYISFLITVFVGTIIFLISIFTIGRFDDISFIDAFWIVSVITLGLFCLIIVASFGVFDFLSYGAKKIFRSFTKNPLTISFYDYTTRERKVEKGVLPGILFGGLLFLIPGIILLLIYLF